MNLFVVSNLGQLYQAQGIIRLRKEFNNILLILYTRRNLDILEKIEKSVDQELFMKVELLQLPDFPLKKNRRVQLSIYKQYENFLNVNKVSNLYLSSFEHHYNFLYHLAKEREIKVILFEEGTATYKNLVPEEDYSRISQIKLGLKKFVKGIVKSFQELIFSFLKPKEINKLQKLLLPKKLKSAMDTIHEFDEAYVAFPEKAKLLFSSKLFHELTVEYELNNDIITQIEENPLLKKIDNKSVIFVNQRYSISNKLHLDIISNFLKDSFGEKFNIFIKMHPKDSNAMKESFRKWANESNNIYLLDFDIEIPIEAILKVKKPGYLVGISSTSLVYTAKNNPEIKVISCADYYLDKLSKSGYVYDREYYVIKYHRDILEKIGNIQIR
jgi:hypothetical protein